MAASPIPGVAGYGQEAVLANNAYNTALAQINKNRLNMLNQAGYRGTVDPTNGTVSGIGVDPHSMYGAYQQMLHGAAAEDQSADYGAADRGIVGGLAHQAHSQAHYQHGADLTSFGSSLLGGLDEFQNQQQQAGETRDAALWQGEQDSLNAELQQQQADSLDQLLAPGGAGAAGGGSSGGGGISASPVVSARTRTNRYGTEDVSSIRRLAKQRAVHKVVNRARRPGRQDR